MTMSRLEKSAHSSTYKFRSRSIPQERESSTHVTPFEKLSFRNNITPMQSPACKGCVIQG